MYSIPNLSIRYCYNSESEKYTRMILIMWDSTCILACYSSFNFRADLCIFVENMLKTMLSHQTLPNFTQTSHSYTPKFRLCVCLWEGGVQSADWQMIYLSFLRWIIIICGYACLPVSSLKSTCFLYELDPLKEKNRKWGQLFTLLTV